MVDMPVACSDTTVVAQMSVSLHATS